MNKFPSFFTNILRALRIPNSFRQSMPYYAVAAGWEVGVFDTWGACEKKVKGFSKPIFKKFKTLQEAENFLKHHGVSITPTKQPFDPINSAIPLLSTSLASKAERVTESVLASENALPGTSFIFQNGKQETSSDPEENWPDDVEYDENDDDILLAAAAEVEGIPDNSRKRQFSETIGTGPTSPKVLKKYQHESKIWEPIGLKKIGNFEFPIDSEGFVIVYTDGSCINNGQANASAGFGVYFSEGHALNTAKPVIGRVTNNAGEIQAAVYAIKIAKDFGISKLCLSTDSQFLINAVTQWMKWWKRKGWVLKSGQPVKNKEDFIVLDELLDGSIEIKWNYVKGHKGIVGNEKADKLARQGSDMYRTAQIF